MAGPIDSKPSFGAHFRMVVVSDPKTLLLDDPRTVGIKEYKPNSGEQVGSLLTWHVTKLPNLIKTAFHNPKICLVALTITTMAFVHLVFYPSSAIEAARVALTFIAKRIDAETVRFTLYLAIQFYVVGLCVRGLGRFYNEELMYRWNPASIPQDKLPPALRAGAIVPPPGNPPVQQPAVVE